MALDMARTPNTLAPFQFMTFPPCPSILISSSCLSGCRSNKKNVFWNVSIKFFVDLDCCSKPKNAPFSNHEQATTEEKHSS